MALAGSAMADTYPSGPVTLIVPYAAGGTTDVVARQFAVALQNALKQSVIVENKPGATGTLGALPLKRARPDGYTLALIPATVFRQPFIQKTAYDPAKDFTYLSRISGYGFVTLMVMVRSIVRCRYHSKGSRRILGGTGEATPGFEARGQLPAINRSVAVVA
jgi:tripartite-type tricarboxylate transporter receptor subunit TctC